MNFQAVEVVFFSKYVPIIGSPEFFGVVVEFCEPELTKNLKRLVYEPHTQIK